MVGLLGYTVGILVIRLEYRIMIMLNVDCTIICILRLVRLQQSAHRARRAYPLEIQNIIQRTPLHVQLNHRELLKETRELFEM
jgi:hypothetical protein